MNVLDSRDELICQEKDGLEGEFPIAEVEEVFKGWTEEVEDHGVVVTFGSKPADERDADTASQGLVDASLVFELRVLGLDGLELDGNLFARDYVGPKVDVTEATTTNFSTDSVLVPHAEILHTGVSVFFILQIQFQGHSGLCPNHLRIPTKNVEGRTMVVILTIEYVLRYRER